MQQERTACLALHLYGKFLTERVRRQYEIAGSVLSLSSAKDIREQAAKLVHPEFNLITHTNYSAPVDGALYGVSAPYGSHGLLQ